MSSSCSLNLPRPIADSNISIVQELPLIRELALWLSSFNNLQLDESQHDMSPTASSPSSTPLNPPQDLPVQEAEEGAGYPLHSEQSSTAYLETHAVIANQVHPMVVMGVEQHNLESGPSYAHDTYIAQAPNLFTSQTDQMIEVIKTQVLPLYAQTLGVRVEPAGTSRAAPVYHCPANPGPNVPFLQTLHHYDDQPTDVILSLKNALKLAAHVVGLQVQDDTACF